MLIYLASFFFFFFIKLIFIFVMVFFFYLKKINRYIEILVENINNNIPINPIIIAYKAVVSEF